MKRLIPAVLAGCVIATLAAETLGEYPLTGAVPWLACAIVPAAIGTAMTAIAGSGRPGGRYRRALWLATGPLSAACLAWGVNIATSWGVEPIPAAGWAEIAIGLAWPVAWALLSGRTQADQRSGTQPSPPGVQRTTSSDIRPS